MEWVVVISADESSIDARIWFPSDEMPASEGRVKEAVKPPVLPANTVATRRNWPLLVSYSRVISGTSSEPTLLLSMGKLEPVTVILLPTRLELGDTVMVGLEMVSDAEAVTPALSVTATVTEPELSVLELTGTMRLVTKFPPLPMLTVLPKFILSLDTGVPPILMLDIVALPPVVKAAPVTAID
jgi:hypothetical protein